MKGSEATDLLRNKRTEKNPVALEVILESRKDLWEAICNS